MKLKHLFWKLRLILSMPLGRRRKRWLSELLSPNVSYFHQGQPWLKPHSPGFDEGELFDDEDFSASSRDEILPEYERDL